MGNTKCLVTNKGRELLNKCQAEGVAMEFTALKSGSGVYDKFDDLKDRTELKEYRQTFDDFHISRQGEETVIRSTLSNEAVNENYKVREIGIWAKEKGTDNEILYAISVTLDDEMADLMFTKKGNYSTALEYNHYFKISESVNVYINADSGGLLQRMYEEFEYFEKNLKNFLEDYREYIEKVLLAQHINSLVTDENGVHGLRAINKSLQVFNDGKWEKLTATDDVLLELERLKSKIDRLNDAIFNDITKNPFLISFNDLDGIIIKKGNFNKEKQRIEC